ncbi:MULTISPECIES: PH domain-containing protein [unclassified Streptomyces]|uniref:PH domain-containing protein n=1 Tax=Streptomyces johnsoniae TaxID=3075532 RepID=A0ABU2S814_9ACTN|nr:MULTISPECIES: PH domain-containing protein [unclassified Streptomyces]MDT0445116.1 PH domain-containing protein [Streptomyces sp. DSM 41886]ONK12504.1 Bacterial membrane flanked domain protein [Streptomyces sp. MP131-18]
MATADRYLAEDEELIYETRQHWTTMISEFLVLCLVAVAAGAVIWVLPTDEDWGGTAVWVVLGAAAVAAVWWWLIPLLQWRATLYFLTTKRLHKRAGFLNKTGTSIPLSRVNDVSFSATLWERIMRYGTVRVQSASEHGMMTLRHVPEPEALKNVIYQALDGLDEDS